MIDQLLHIQHICLNQEFGTFLTQPPMVWFYFKVMWKKMQTER